MLAPSGGQNAFARARFTDDHGHTLFGEPLLEHRLRIHRFEVLEFSQARLEPFVAFALRHARFEVIVADLCSGGQSRAARHQGGHLRIRIRFLTVPVGADVSRRIHDRNVHLEIFTLKSYNHP